MVRIDLDDQVSDSEANQRDGCVMAGKAWLSSHEESVQGTLLFAKGASQVSFAISFCIASEKLSDNT